MGFSWVAVAGTELDHMGMIGMGQVKGLGLIREATVFEGTGLDQGKALPGPH